MHSCYIDTAAERVGLATALEREEHRLGHAGKSLSLRQAEIERSARAAQPLRAEGARNREVAALRDEHVRPLARDAPPDVVREGEFADDGAGPQARGVDHVHRRARRGQHELGVAHARRDVGRDLRSRTTTGCEGRRVTVRGASDCARRARRGAPAAPAVRRTRNRSSPSRRRRRASPLPRGCPRPRHRAAGYGRRPRS